MKDWVFSLISFFAIILAVLVFDNPKEMPRQFSGAYFSGASNIKLNKEYVLYPESRFKVDTLQVYTFMNTRDPFHFKNSSSTIPYYHNSIGFAWICKFAKTVFWFLPDNRALEWLQILVHALICLVIIGFLKPFHYKLLFIVLYGVNPLVLYVVTYPYYYFWTCAVAFILLPYLLKPGFQWGKALWFLMIVMGCILASRSVVLLPVLLIFAFIILRERKQIAGISLFIFLVSAWFFWSPNQKNLPFTAYLGLGAYTSHILPNMNDENALALSPIKLRSADLNKAYYDNAFQSSYRKILKERYIEKIKEHPFLVLRNAFLNIGCSLSIGYLNDYSFLFRLISALAGFVFIGLLLYKKMYLWVIAIFVNSLGYVLYYPPIQIYMFGNYLLLVCALIVFLDKILLKRKNEVSSL